MIHFCAEKSKHIDYKQKITRITCKSSNADLETTKQVRCCENLVAFSAVLQRLLLSSCMDHWLLIFSFGLSCITFHNILKIVLYFVCFFPTMREIVLCLGFYLSFFLFKALRSF